MASPIPNGNIKIRKNELEINVNNFKIFSYVVSLQK